MATTFNTEVNITDVLFYDLSVPSFIARDKTTGDYFDDDSAVWDILYFSRDRNGWKWITINVGTALVATSISVVWERFGVGGRTALTWLVDPSNTFQNIGTHKIDFDVPDWRWSAYSPTGAAWDRGTYVRCRITAVAWITEWWANSTNHITVWDNAMRIVDAGVRLSDLYDDSVAGGWNAITKDEKQFKITSNLWIKDWWELFMKNWEDLQMWSQYAPRIFMNDTWWHFQMWESSPDSRWASLFYWNATYTPYNYWRGTWYMYNSRFTKNTGSYTDPTPYWPSKVINSIVASATSQTYFYWWGSPEFKNAIFDLAGGNLYIYTAATYDNLVITNSPYLLSTVPMTLRNTTIPSWTRFWFARTNYEAKVINCIFIDWYEVGTKSSGGLISIQYTLWFLVKDSDWIEITSPNITIKDVGWNVVFDWPWVWDEDISVFTRASAVVEHLWPFEITVKKTWYIDYMLIDYEITEKKNIPVPLETAKSFMLDTNWNINILAVPSKWVKSVIVK